MNPFDASSSFSVSDSSHTSMPISPLSFLEPIPSPAREAVSISRAILITNVDSNKIGYEDICQVWQRVITDVSLPIYLVVFVTCLFSLLVL